jgi:acetyl-CoA carboxylase biotin carboxyl carrier protein
MDLDYLKTLVEFARKEGLGGLEIEDKTKKVKFHFAAEQGETSRPMWPGQQPFFAPPSQEGAPVSQAPVAATKSQFHEIKSPFVGTFYRASAPGKPSLADVGQTIKAGQSLCIVEAMKIMNEIESDCHGEIVEVCAENESYVEFGQVLFKIKKS